MNKNIIKTKKKLTLIFTIIVTLVIIFLWVSFFSFKYYNELKVEKNILNDIWKKIQSEEIDIDKFIQFSRVSWTNVERKDIWKHFLNRARLKQWKPINTGPLSYIEFNKSEIISYDIKSDIEEGFIKEIFNSTISNKSFELDWFIIRKVTIWEKGIILFKNIRYNLSDYISDNLIFILVTLIFSSLLYFIWNRFVNKAFIPVESNIKDMNDFIHNAGHELKTPIAVIDSNIQYINDVKVYDQSMMDEMKQETKKLNSLINSLIKLSDISDLKVVTEQVDLKELVEEILNNSKELIPANEIQIKTKISKKTYIHADRDYFYIMLSNLIWNAIKYNTKKWKINIIYKNRELIIKDTWIGMTRNEIEHIFNRFYKADTSRNTEGFGIGLSLVKKIVDMYKWDIEVESEKDQWSKFRIKF
jgi:signal transduction histidine kinase